MEEFQKIIVQMLKANMDQQQKFEERQQLHQRKFEERQQQLFMELHKKTNIIPTTDTEKNWTTAKTTRRITCKFIK